MFLNLVNPINIKECKIICLGKKTGNIFKNLNWKKIQVIDDINLKNFAKAIIDD